MATSRKELYDKYKARGGKKTFKEYSDRAIKVQRKNATKKTASATKKVDTKKKMVSGKLRKNLRKPMKTKHSI